jgi:hypothetical protein
MLVMIDTNAKSRSTIDPLSTSDFRKRVRTIRCAHAVQAVAAVQREYSRWRRVPEKEICRRSRKWESASLP